MLCKQGSAAHMQAVHFYKAWDAYGALSNFSCHAVNMPEGPLSDANSPPPSSPLHQREWRSVEHYYQAQKFATPSGKLQPELLPCLLLIIVHMLPRSCANLLASFDGIYD